MIKGIAQSERNNAWHKKHTNKLASQRASHENRLLNRSNGVNQISTAEKNYRLAQKREATKNVGVWAWLKYRWLMARIQAKVQIKKIFGANQIQNA